MRQIVRPRPARWAVAVVSVTTLAWLISGTSAGAAAHGRGHPPARATAVRLSAQPSTGASDITNLGSGGWAVQSSAVATQSGAQISTPGFNTSTWLPVTSDDAGAPGTEIEALAQNGMCPG